MELQVRGFQDADARAVESQDVDSQDGSEWWVGLRSDLVDYLRQLAKEYALSEKKGLGFKHW